MFMCFKIVLGPYKDDFFYNFYMHVILFHLSPFKGKL